MPNRLRELLGGGLIQAPGAYDGLTARLVEAAGFPAVYMTGYGTAASFGLPDQGIIGQKEMLGNVERIAEAVQIPLIADGDTGYGGPNEVAETVRLYEQAGADAIQLEDQQWPKRCGHMDGKAVVSQQEMIAKVEAARNAADEILIIARTDAIAVEGFDAAIDRASAYKSAGADILFVEAPTDAMQMRQIPERIPDVLHLANLAPRTPPFSATQLAEMGFALAIYPGICLMSQWTATIRELQGLIETGSQENLIEWKERFADMNAFLSDTPRANQ